MGIERLLKKFDKVKKAVNSIKGIQSKIQSINYTTALDSLGESQKLAEDLLSTRRDNLQKDIGSSKIGQGYSKKSPTIDDAEGALIYPKYDELANYIFFVSRPRRYRAGAKDHPIYKRRRCALYIPDTLISQANVSYNAQSIGGVARTLEQIRQNIMNNDGFGKTVEQVNKLGTKFIQSALNQMTGGLNNVRKGRAVNPLMEQTLDSIPFRSWDFTFDFWPKSQDEAKTVNEIIYFFRSSMLPDTYSDKIKLSAEGMTEVMVEDMETNANYLNYPNVFDISFKGPVGRRVDGFLPAVCTNAQVDYSGGQKFSTFVDGQPVHIQLTLNFLEISVLTIGNYEGISNVGPGGLKRDSSIANQASETLDDVADDETGTGT